MIDQGVDVSGPRSEMTVRLKDLSDQALAEKDHATYNLLQLFVIEQVEEEASAIAIIAKVEMVGGEGYGLWKIDNELALRVHMASEPARSTLQNDLDQTPTAGAIIGPSRPMAVKQPQPRAEGSTSAITNRMADPTQKASSTIPAIATGAYEPTTDANNGVTTKNPEPMIEESELTSSRVCRRAGLWSQQCGTNDDDRIDYHLDRDHGSLPTNFTIGRWSTRTTEPTTASASDVRAHRRTWLQRQPCVWANAQSGKDHHTAHNCRAPGEPPALCVPRLAHRLGPCGMTR